MASLLYQTIDQLSREKGIDPEIIVDAIEDAMAVATRKYYKSGEDLKAEFNKKLERSKFSPSARLSRR